jgi:hypothetical protein
MTSTNPSPRAGHHYSAAEMHNDDVAHEHSDVSIRSVLAFGAGMAAIVIVAAALMYILLRVLEGQAERRDPQISPVAQPSGQEPPAPRLLTNEPANLSKFRMEEMKKLEGYGWIDERGGVARLPIEEAKKLTVQRGLPVRASGTVDDPLVGTHAPAYGEASGGRAIAVPKKAPAPVVGEIKN